MPLSDEKLSALWECLEGAEAMNRAAQAKHPATYPEGGIAPTACIVEAVDLRALLTDRDATRAAIVYALDSLRMGRPDEAAARLKPIIMEP